MTFAGQKIWTSGAHHADRAILLARTDPDSAGNSGITYFLVDMHQPGIDVRPIVQINRARHFNEVYLDEVRVDDADRLGPLGEGPMKLIFSMPGVPSAAPAHEKSALIGPPHL